MARPPCCSTSSSSKKAAATRALLLMLRQLADCPDTFKDNTIASALNHPRRSKHLHQQQESPPLGRIATRVTFPHPDPATKLTLFPLPWTNSGCSEKALALGTAPP
ncbi:hypothetical protein GWK47_002444 [Chionoecetes opilio]|uniref:Uncharacterized protein n=1 Tax=Chionoecetes opilio TaxID=41210 RepID=A0A8J4XSF9_CHIOP|nr:hypothetical protein GWK47_002444 [Chionoecetes opilio]